MLNSLGYLVGLVMGLFMGSIFGLSFNNLHEVVDVLIGWNIDGG